MNTTLSYIGGCKAEGRRLQGRRQEAGGRRQEVGGRRQEAGGKNFFTGNESRLYLTPNT
ncbi:MAG: hypothetical protein F6K47_16190 [Symploca sp. SIO2E6]|nr:hypothetical protein [Symploca sp. SIO2E6]